MYQLAKYGKKEDLISLYVSMKKLIVDNNEQKYELQAPPAGQTS